MDNQNQQLSAGFPERVNQTAVFRAVWLFIAAGVVSLVVAATPLRYQMLQADVYGFADGLQSLGLSLPLLCHLLYYPGANFDHRLTGGGGVDRLETPQ